METKTAPRQERTRRKPALNTDSETQEQMHFGFHDAEPADLDSRAFD